MLNKKDSEVSMGNASNYLLSPGALVCALALRVQMDLQTLGKVGILFILSIPTSSNKGFKGRGFGELKAVISFLRTESMLREGPQGRNKKKYERGIVSDLKS